MHLTRLSDGLAPASTARCQPYFGNTVVSGVPDTTVLPIGATARASNGVLARTVPPTSGEAAKPTDAAPPDGHVPPAGETTPLLQAVRLGQRGGQCPMPVERCLRGRRVRFQRGEVQSRA